MYSKLLLNLRFGFSFLTVGVQMCSDVVKRDDLIALVFPEPSLVRSGENYSGSKTTVSPRRASGAAPVFERWAATAGSEEM